MTIKVSVIIPVYNDYHALSDLLVPLAQAQTQRDDFEIIVADGGSTDGSVMQAKQFADNVVNATQGRASQQNAGAAIAQGQVLWFLHADSLLDFSQFNSYISQLQTKSWGRFDIVIRGEHVLLPVIAFFVNWRSRLSGIATGDQAIFVQKRWFQEVGGFPKQALMEDIALSLILRRKMTPLCIRTQKIATSGRKWQQEGVFRTIFKMWWIRLQYFFGVSPDKLVKQYYKK